MLNLNPELYTIWNYRRDILLNGGFERSERIKLIEFDLKMVMTFLRQYPKCYWVWNHRVWCLYELSESGDANWKFELMMVEKLLDLDARNFHGWQYRRIIVENMEKEAGDTKRNRQHKIRYWQSHIKNTSTRLRRSIRIFQISRLGTIDPKYFQSFTNFGKKINP